MSDSEAERDLLYSSESLTKAGASATDIVKIIRRYAEDYLRAHLAHQPAARSNCNPHPDAPHGFDRQASHAENRYVCECEGWEQPAAQSDGRIAATLIDEMLDAGKHPTMAAGFYFFKPAEIASWKSELERRIGQPAAREPEGQSYNDGLEAAAKIVDECNRSGPYDAIGAATKIRAMLRASSPTEGESK